MVADMYTQIDAARLLVRRAAFNHDVGLPFTKEAAMAKPVSYTHLQPAAKLQVPPAEASNAKEKTLAKRVLTERDLIDAEKQGVACIRVGAGCIITALAKDLAAGRGITIIKGQD